ncbi:hypothetical protein [Bifidobacterium avesanii]|uniref:Uncharacterized protein n=2 Tax=Bifidobacterium avesanii TaxID=1798157 RepID=A0A7K3TFW6_9BIFI|nr:hypothetical protein [Bifidobacterium avesanii]NEG77987.1 hypothetical protein [Bifidobacterium avesanii]
MAALAGCAGGSSGTDGRAAGVTDEMVRGSRSTYAQFTADMTLSPAYMQRINNELAAGTNKRGHEAVHAVVDDGVITADEMNEAERRMVGCYAKYGYEVNRDYWLGDYGGLSPFVKKSEDTWEHVDEIRAECEDDTGWGWVSQYYWAVYTNPENIDLGPYQYQCLKEKGMLLKDYPSYEDFKRDWENPGNNEPVINSSKSAQAFDARAKCFSDPLHNISNAPTGQ